MEYEIDNKNGAATLRLRGEMTYADGETFERTLHEFEGHDLSNCAVNFEHLEFIDSSGLRMLLLYELAKTKKRDLKFVAPRGEVAERLNFVRFETIIDIVP